MNLRTLAGITAEREEMYTKLKSAEISEQRALAMEKVLRGQQIINGDMRLKALGLFMGNKKFEPFAADLAQGLTQFINGPAELKA